MTAALTMSSTLHHIYIYIFYRQYTADTIPYRINYFIYRRPHASVPHRFNACLFCRAQTWPWIHSEVLTRPLDSRTFLPVSVIYCIKNWIACFRSLPCSIIHTLPPWCQVSSRSVRRTDFLLLHECAVEMRVASLLGYDLWWKSSDEHNSLISSLFHLSAGLK